MGQFYEGGNGFGIQIVHGLFKYFFIKLIDKTISFNHAVRH